MLTPDIESISTIVARTHSRFHAANAERNRVKKEWKQKRDQLERIIHHREQETREFREKLEVFKHSPPSSVDGSSPKRRKTTGTAL